MKPEIADEPKIVAKGGKICYWWEHSWRCNREGLCITCLLPRNIWRAARPAVAVLSSVYSPVYSVLPGLSSVYSIICSCLLEISNSTSLL